MIILGNQEDKVIWTNGSLLLINDPTLIKSIGGEYLIKNYLKKSPTIYDIAVKENTLQIIGENALEEMCEAIQELISKPKKDFSKITIKEFGKLKEKRGFGSGIVHADYIKGTFEDKNLETFGNEDHPFLYFFEGEKLKAITG